MKAYVRRQYRMCLGEGADVGLGIRGEMPRSSSSSCFARLEVLGTAGRLVQYVAMSAPPIVRGNVSVNSISTAYMPRGDYTLLVTLQIPDDSYGSAAEIRFLVTGVTYDQEELIGGMRYQCFETREPPLLTSEGHDFQSRAEAAFHARVIENLYLSVDKALPLVEQFCTPPPRSIDTIEVTGVPGSGAILARASGRAFLWLIGSTTNEQLTTQGLQMANGPVTYGNVSSIPIWRGGALLVNALLNQAALTSDIPLSLYGHSLGGPVLALAAAWLRQAWPQWNIELMTFGSPRIGGASMVNLCNSLNANRHWVNDGDLVPWLPPHPAELGPLVLNIPILWQINFSRFAFPDGRTGLNADGEEVSGANLFPVLEQLAPLIAAWLLGAPSPAIANHAIGEYRRRLESGL